MKVLFLSAWYPTERDRMYGLFVEKHLKAVCRQGADARVIYNEKVGLAWWRQMYKDWKYLLNSGWKPDIVQVNVNGRNALFALYLYKKYNIPYIIVEHWTGYLPLSFQLRSPLKRFVFRFGAKYAQRIMPVSANLGEAMQNCGLKGNYEVLNNVVDDFFYTVPRDTQSDVINTLHVSCFDEEHKNVCGILRVFARMKHNYPRQLRLTLVGTGKDFALAVAYARTLGLEEGEDVIFTGEQPPIEVAKFMSQADLFVLFSNKENAPVVISESLAAGVPVLSSDVGGIKEMITPESGRLIRAKDETALEKEWTDMLKNLDKYNAETIRESARKYSFNAVGERLIIVYNEVAKHK